MTESTHQDEADDRYGTFETMQGETVLYDRENPNAWIQATEVVPVGADAETAASE